MGIAAVSTWTMPARLPAYYHATGRALDRDAVWIACLAGLAALQIALITQHVPWLDEWQALLIAVQSPDTSALLGNLRYEGHPPLWYFLLRELAQIIPFENVLMAAALAVALPLQCLILFRAPFPRLERLLLGLGEIALFEYGTIARSLALGALAMTAAAALWRRKEVWIALAVLPLCDFLFGVVGLILIALRWRERSPSGLGLAGFGISAALAAWTVRPASDLVPAEVPAIPAVELANFLQRLGALIVPFNTYLGQPSWDGVPPLSLGLPLGVVMLIWVWQRYAGDRAQLCAVFSLVALCGAMSVFIYPLHFRHLTVIAWLMVVLAWIAPVSLAREQARWRWWLALGAIGGLATSAVALSRPFDMAGEVVEAMSRLDDGKTPWLAFPAQSIPSVAARTGSPLTSADRSCGQTFIRWNHQSVRTAGQVRRSLFDWADRYGRSFLLIERVPRGVPREVFTPLTPTMRGYDGQRYMIGLLAPDKASKPFTARPCVAGLKPLA